MTTSFLPRSHAERDEIIAAITSYIASSTAKAALVAYEDEYFRSARTGYISARTAVLEATATARIASQAADAADAAFDRDLRWFAGSVRDNGGTISTRTVSALLGGILASDLCHLPHRKEVERVNGMFVQLAKYSADSFDAALVTALQTSTAALELAAKADEDAARTLKGARGNQAAATSAFDLAFRSLLSTAKGMLTTSELAAVFPRFQRGSASTAGSTATASAAG